jgi:hypothetical protein
MIYQCMPVDRAGTGICDTCGRCSPAELRLASLGCAWHETPLYTFLMGTQGTGPCAVPAIPLSLVHAAKQPLAMMSASIIEGATLTFPMYKATRLETRPYINVQQY